jgi:hypothetical protein
MISSGHMCGNADAWCEQCVRAAEKKRRLTQVFEMEKFNMEFATNKFARLLEARKFDGLGMKVRDE